MANSVAVCEKCGDLKMTDTAYKKHLQEIHPPVENVTERKTVIDMESTKPSPKKPTGKRPIR